MALDSGNAESCSELESTSQETRDDNAVVAGSTVSVPDAHSRTQELSDTVAGIDDEDHNFDRQQQAQAPPSPYSVFSPQQKWAIVVLAACAGLFSPLGANIYFPAIPSLSKAFHRSVQDIKCVAQFGKCEVLNNHGHGVTCY